MDRKSGDIEVEHVYDLASEIGDQFQKIIDNYGSDIVAHLMPKVIRVLEHLEMLTLRKDDTDTELDSLKLNIYQLEHDKLEKAEHHNKIEMEMELIDENWRKENLQLTELVNRLRQKNIKLTNSLIDRETTLSQSLTELQARGQMEIESELNSLRNSIKRSDDKIENLSKDLEIKNEEIEKLYEQIENIMQQNRDLRRRIKNIQSQVRHFVEEKGNLHTDLNDGHKKGITNNRMILTNDRSSDKELDGISEPLSESPKQTFSLSEIRNMIHDRNSLRKRVHELEDELNELKNVTIDNTCNYRRQSTQTTHNSTTEEEDEDLPVQGPINREPEDKLYPKKHSNRILRFFPALNWSRIKRP